MPLRTAEFESALYTDSSTAAGHQMIGARLAGSPLQCRVRRGDRTRKRGRDTVHAMDGDRSVLSGETASGRPAIRATDGKHRVVFADHSVVCQGADGTITDERHGLFDMDARLLSHFSWTVDGMAPTLVSSAVVDDDRWLGTFVVPIPGGNAAGPRLPQDCLGIRIERTVGPAMHDRWLVSNHSSEPTRFQLRIELAADLADMLEVGGPDVGKPVPGTLTGGGSTVGDRSIVFERVVSGPSGEVRRGTRVRLAADADITWDGSALTGALELGPGRTWLAEIAVDGLYHGEWRGSFGSASVDGREPLPLVRQRERQAWRSERTRIRTVPPLLGQVAERAIEDLFALRDRESETGEGWVLNAGVPSYTGLFGRDILTSGWQAAMADRRPVIGALAAVAATQTEADDPWRDAEPGKLIHERRLGPLGEAGLSPRDAYYGSHTVPAMFALALSEAWHWIGDESLLRQHLSVAERATAWATKQISQSPFGFLAYETRSPQGLRNQAWKDSDEAIRHPDGTLVDTPIATVEEQAFHIVGLERLGEIRLALGDEAAAERHLAAAAALRRRWHETFWQDDLGFYAMALGGDGRAVRTIGSNAGHALGAGIVPREHAVRVVERLLAPDLFSGWGVRTLSSEHPSYQPFAYHLGAVWPVEHATFLLGAKRYGFDDAVDRIAEGLVSAAGASPDRRLPEALSGLARDEWPVPVPYPTANVPQAWSSSAVVQLVQTLVGAYPFAPAHLLALVRPRLPEWVEMLSIDRLRVGDATVSLRFVRQPDGSASHEVTEQDGRLFVLEVPPPQVVDDVGIRDSLDHVGARARAGHDGAAPAHRHGTRDRAHGSSFGGEHERLSLGWGARDGPPRAGSPRQRARPSRRAGRHPPAGGRESRRWPNECARPSRHRRPPDARSSGGRRPPCCPAPRPSHGWRRQRCAAARVRRCPAGAPGGPDRPTPCRPTSGSPSP